MVRRLVIGGVIGAVASIGVQAARVRGLLPRRAQARSAELETMTKEELYARAQAEDVPGRSEMTKDELIRALRSAS
jgi:hypothetical protein